MTVATVLPHWDMSTIYPSLESPEFTEAFGRVISDIEEFGALLDRYEIGPREDGTVDDRTVEAFEAVIAASDALDELLWTVSAYIRAFVTTDSYDALAQGRQSELQQHTVRLSQLSTRVTAWIGSLDVDTLISRSSAARERAFALHKEAREASHLMPLPEENLAAELQPSGSSAWSKLASNVSSQLMVPVDLPSGAEVVPMTVIRIMAYDPNRAVRRAAYEAELEAWRGVSTPMAAALNSIKGESNALFRRRGWPSPLDFALFNNNIDRETLDAMLSAARAAFPDFRRYLRAKAHALGLPALTWYDLFAPLGADRRAWSWEEGRDFLLEQFGAYSGRLRDFAAGAFADRWIDAEPRNGKVGGAFCMRVRPGESRVLTNFVPSYEGVSTVAHELGHAYHNLNLRDRSPMQRQTPMTLAETASIFCETIIEHAALARAGREEQIAILESSIQGACQVTVDITSRFLFESAVFAAREKRELSVEELNELMLDAQRQTYGDGLDQSVLHPFMWAVKTHYYSAMRPFYNYPYMFGLLFGLGLYARFQQDPEGFRARYDDLLSSTGMDDAATLAARFGIDIRTPEFWTSSLDIVRGNIDRFEQLVGA